MLTARTCLPFAALAACLLAAPLVAADAPATRPATTRQAAETRPARSSPLLEATTASRYEDALALVNSGADVNAANGYGTPLFIAVSGDARAMPLIEALVARGADVNVRCIGGFTPLHEASLLGTPAAVAFLLSKGADPTAQDDPSGDTPLHVAAARKPDSSRGVRGDYAEGGDVAAVVDLLLKRKLDLNAKDRDGKTPLDYAEQLGTPKMVAALEARGAKRGNAIPATGPATAPATAPGSK